MKSVICMGWRAGRHMAQVLQKRGQGFKVWDQIKRMDLVRFCFLDVSQWRRSHNESLAGDPGRKLSTVNHLCQCQGIEGHLPFMMVSWDWAASDIPGFRVRQKMFKGIRLRSTLKWAATKGRHRTRGMVQEHRIHIPHINAQFLYKIHFPYVFYMKIHITY